MINIVVVFLIMIVVGFVLIGLILIYNRFQSLIIKINEAESLIDSVLRKRFDLMMKITTSINNTLNIEESIKSILNIKSKKISNFDLDRKLIEANNEFISFKELHKELEKNDNIIKCTSKLKETDHEIIAYKKYYNDTITKYNKFRKSFPSVIIAIIFSFKSRNYFDNKDMNDDIINDFKL